MLLGWPMLWRIGAWRRVTPGVVVASLLLELGKSCFGLSAAFSSPRLMPISSVGD